MVAQKEKTTKKTAEKAVPAVAERYAIIQTGGKQYQAIEGKTLGIEKLDGEDGSKVEFKEVLLRKLSADKLEIGQPFVKGAAVKGVILKQDKGPKVLSFRFKRRKKVMVKKGHRQPITVVRVESIG